MNGERLVDAMKSKYARYPEISASTHHFILCFRGLCFLYPWRAPRHSAVRASDKGFNEKPLKNQVCWRHAVLCDLVLHALTDGRTDRDRREKPRSRHPS